MKPYSVMQTPPMTQLGMVERKVTNGPKKEAMIAMQAVQRIVTTDALPVMATQPMLSP